MGSAQVSASITVSHTYTLNSTADVTNPQVSIQSPASISRVPHGLIITMFEQYGIFYGPCELCVQDWSNGDPYYGTMAGDECINQPL